MTGPFPRGGEGEAASHLGSVTCAGLAGDANPNCPRQASMARPIFPFFRLFGRPGFRWPVEDGARPGSEGGRDSSISKACRRRCSSMINAAPCGPTPPSFPILAQRSDVLAISSMVSSLNMVQALSAACRRDTRGLGTGVVPPTAVLAAPFRTRAKISSRGPNAIALPS